MCEWCTEMKATLVGSRPYFFLSFVTLLDSDSDILRADGAHCLK